MKIIRADQRHFSDFGWLKTYRLFSFSNYYDPENLRFGPLRVFNDDFVGAGKGFGMHRHEEMEIITIILEGQLTHKDDMGNTFINRPGDVQRMSAGTGVTHSEFNNSDETLHLYQIWIEPEMLGLTPSYDQHHFEQSEWGNKRFALASGQGLTAGVTFHADATIYRSAMDRGTELTHPVSEQRKLFLYVTSGQIEVDGETLYEKDQARLETGQALVMRAQEDSDLILIDLPI